MAVAAAAARSIIKNEVSGSRRSLACLLSRATTSKESQRARRGAAPVSPSPGTQKTRRRTFEMKAGISPINYAWQREATHIIKRNSWLSPAVSRRKHEAAAAAIYFHPAKENRFAGGEGYAPLPTTTTGCVKINNCSRRSRLIGERRTRCSEFIYLLPIIRSRTAKAFAGGIERNGAGISPPHYITLGVGLD